MESKEKERENGGTDLYGFISQSRNLELRPKRKILIPRLY